MTSPTAPALKLMTERQAQRRRFNDRLSALGSDDSAEEATPVRCECGLIACGAVIKLTATEYADVRSDPRRFAVLAEHALPDAERVLGSRRGWATVEKFPGPASAIAVRTYAPANRADHPHPVSGCG